MSQGPRGVPCVEAKLILKNAPVTGRPCVMEVVKADMWGSSMTSALRKNFLAEKPLVSEFPMVPWPWAQVRAVTSRDSSAARALSGEAEPECDVVLSWI